MLTAPLVALVDFRRDGHHLTYLRFFHRTLTAAGYRVVVFSPATGDEARLSFAGEAGGAIFVKVEDEIENSRWVRKTPQSENLHRFRRAARQLHRFEKQGAVKFDFVFFSTLYHGAVSSIALLDEIFPYRWVSVLIDSACCRENRIRHARRMRTLDSLAAFRCKYCAGLATMDEGIVDRLQQRIGKDKPVYWLPEISSVAPPNQDLLTAEKILDRAAGRAVIGGLGQFGLRKGAIQFIETARASCNEDWLFAWIGELDLRNCTADERAFIQDFVANPPPNCFLQFDGRIEEEADFDRLVEISSVLFACYRKHIGSSNVISKAGWLEKPLIVHDLGSMAESVRRYGLGLCIDPGSPPEEYVEAIRRALAGEGFAPRYAEFRARYSPGRQGEVVRQMAANALGKLMSVQPALGSAEGSALSTCRTSQNVGR
jgi:glycosyltransferase involved in cell wall biosynthesis